MIMILNGEQKNVFLLVKILLSSLAINCFVIIIIILFFLLFFGLFRFTDTLYRIKQRHDKTVETMAQVGV